MQKSSEPGDKLVVFFDGYNHFINIIKFKKRKLSNQDDCEYVH